MVKTSADYTRPTKFVIPFFCLQLSCFVLLSILLFTFQRVKGIHRDATLRNMLLVFTVNSLLTSLLLFTGKLQDPTVEPSFGLCVVNGSSVMGGSSGLAGSAFSVVFRVFTRIIASQGYAVRIMDSKWFTFALLALPWSLWGGVAFASIAISLHNKPLLHRAVFYCTVDHERLGATTTAITASVTGLTIIIQLLMFGLLVYHRRALRKVLRPASSSVIPSSSDYPEPSDNMRENDIPLQPDISSLQDSPQEEEEAAAAATVEAPDAYTQRSPRRKLIPRKSLNKSRQLKGLHGGLILRIGLFMFCVVLAFVISIVVAHDFTSVTGDLAIASIGPAVFLIFASQDDVLRTWGLLKPARGHLDSNPSPPGKPPPDPHPNSSMFNAINTTRSYLSFKYFSRSQANRQIGQGRDFEIGEVSFRVGQIETRGEEPFTETLQRDSKSVNDSGEPGIADLNSDVKS